MACLEFAQTLIDVAQFGERARQSRVVIQHLALRFALQERLVFVLAMDIHQQFAEFTDAYQIQSAFGEMIESAVAVRP